MKIFLLIVAFVVIASVDLLGLVKAKKRTRTMFVYFSLTAIVFTLSFLYVIDRAPQGPAAVMEKMIRVIIPGKYTFQ